MITVTSTFTNNITDIIELLSALNPQYTQSCVTTALTRWTALQTDIQARYFSLTDALRSHAEQRLLFALTCCDDYI